MYLMVFSINITRAQIQRFTQTQSHTINNENKNPISEFTNGIENDRHFSLSQNIRQCLYVGWFNNIDPIPLFFQHMFVKELKCVADNLNQAPRTGID